jgi:hypothetical protein
MSKPSARTASQTSRSFFPVANPASISGQIHATRPVLVAGSIPGSERRLTSSDFVLFRSGKAEFADVARTKPLHIRAQNRSFGQELQIYLLATIRNRSKQPATAGRDLGQRQPSATVCNQSAVQKGSKDRVVEHKGIVERVGVFSLATSVRSVLSAVGQTALRVRLMFDTEITAKKSVQKGLSEPLSVEGLFL